jgi:hypothetical protein
MRVAHPNASRDLTTRALLQRLLLVERSPRYQPRALARDRSPSPQKTAILLSMQEAGKIQPLPVDEADAIRRAMADFDKATFPDRPEYLELQRSQKRSWARTLMLEAERLLREADAQN